MRDTRNEGEMSESRELNAQADEWLARNGYDIWGKKRTREGYVQDKFEGKMWTGAFRNNSEKNRKRQYN